ncbi:Bcr/CflA family multidrug efflux MFS transporter [Sansalvadorimonas sp. 2012CJ34-2]|uniref:Bcr/CflA family efflux transporter n=1 Tax=Parendozoicomonas callyspongiae TaxID=2942213 RepID=A0ABT0PHP3_9GAMM|nr:Bcr/CflA family multidrug efflux MFS transporter [Sansalvadorimonas sp. 2012CJ34-2]MCL6270897.1 Bcr/CflA family multidrug efflux MFS transporter [Sansalvadorimonas sp. 2012CJ34-2]
MNSTTSTQSQRFLILILGALTCLGPMAIDLYLPAMPAIAKGMGEPLGLIQLTLSAYTIGFALGQVIFGPLSDRFGRRRVMLSGLVGYVLTNFLATMTETATQLIVVRIFQALAGASVMVCIPAMVRDLFPRKECARAMSSILLVMTIAPLVAPVIGGHILRFAGWQSLFLFLSVLGVLALLLSLAQVKESLPAERRTYMTPRKLLQSYKDVMTHREAMSCILAHGFFFGGMFAFISGSPFVYIELFGVPAENYGYLFGMNILGMAFCNVLNMRLMNSFPLHGLLRFGVGMSFLASLIMLLNAWTGFGGLAGIAAPVVLYIACSGFSGPNANALALAHFPKIAGTANAAAGVVRFTLGGITAGLAGILHNGTVYPMVGLMVVCGLLSVLSLIVLGGSREKTEAELETANMPLEQKEAA